MEEAQVWPQQAIRWRRNAGASSGKTLRAMDFEQNFTRNGEPSCLYEQGRDMLITTLEG